MAKFDVVFESIKAIFFKDAKGRFRKRSIDDFENIKNQIIGRAGNNNLVNELEGNKGSSFIDGASGKSFSLFGVLGFEVGRSPREEIIAALNDEIEIIGSPGGNAYYLKLPELKDLDNNETLSLQGRSHSWVYYIEEGVDNLSFYYEKDNYGRSEIGFQAKNENNLGRSFGGIEFLTKIFNEFKEKYKGNIKII